ncbi:hypothetical protein KGQ20_39840 [Catenulispora sp. NF23]|uniref:hypothetical protein n=1 Tax=Catenulispora pinistramenti TaxID=2705254 RepID=UPI001BAA01F1|nr:hypothetical protein [Catenulispora pinistramenti]MBS2538917.1 hypothetical protein [Catenulispora pinistramenti]
MTGTLTRTRVAGHPAKCRCTGCFARLARYRKQRQLALHRGTWTRPVPVGEVAALLNELLAGGWTASQIGHAAGLSAVYVRILLGDGSTPPPVTVRSTTARAIAALGPESRLGPAVPDSTLISPIGSIRRLRSLAAIGWPRTELCQRLGLASPPILEPGRLILASRARTIADLYRQLWNVPGPSNSAAIRARRQGAVPPTAWDDDTIDDPRAQPSGATDPAKPGPRSRGTHEYIVGEVAFLAAAGETTENIARRMQITVGYVETLLGTNGEARCLA